MTERPEPSAADSSAPLLRLQGIGKNFGPVQSLAGVDLDIPAGQVTALAGDNGAGKSVLTKCIAGIYAPDAGQLFWEGRPVHLHSPSEAALGIETVYQDLALCNNLDIVQNMFRPRAPGNFFLLDEESMESQREKPSGLAVTTVRSIRQPVASLSVASDSQSRRRQSSEFEADRDVDRRAGSGADGSCSTSSGGWQNEVWAYC
jgi:ABC-type sugar transport system ATPase subunit